MDKNAIWDRTPPNLHINCSLHVWGRVQGSQIFKQNSIILIRSKVMAFLVILWSPRRPRHPHVIPVSPRHPHIITVLSLSSPHHPHSPQKVPCGPHGCGLSGLLCCLRGLHPMLSPWSPCRPRRPHIVPVLCPSSPHHLEGPHIIPNNPDTHSTQPPPPWGWGAPNQ